MDFLEQQNRRNAGDAIAESESILATGKHVIVIGGGLVGENPGTISNSYATTSVTGATYVGGLVGANAATFGVAQISNAYATGSVLGEGSTSYVGGLVGYNHFASIANAYSAGSVSDISTPWVGGFVGFNDSVDHERLLERRPVGDLCRRRLRVLPGATASS